jgi:CRISPR locus-related DNA-binding protein
MPASMLFITLIETSSFRLYICNEFIFLVPENTTGRSENTFLMIKQFMDVLNTRGPKIKYEFVHINEEYVKKSLQVAYDKLSEKKGHFIFDLSGGLRVLVITAYILAQLLRNRVLELSCRVENSSKKVTLPLLPLFKLTQADVRILKKIFKDKESTQREIASDIGRKISSVSRVIMDLEMQGFVSKMEGKPSRYVLTELGSLILKWQIDSKIKFNLNKVIRIKATG